MRTQDEPEKQMGLGKPIRPEPKAPEDKVEKVGPGIWRVNGKLQTFEPPKPIDWEAIRKALEGWADTQAQPTEPVIDIIVLECGILQVPRDPEFPREEWGSF